MHARTPLHADTRPSEETRKRTRAHVRACKHKEKCESARAETVLVSRDGSLTMVDKHNTVWRAEPDGRGGYRLLSEQRQLPVEGRVLGFAFAADNSLVACVANVVGAYGWPAPSGLRASCSGCYY